MLQIDQLIACLQSSVNQQGLLADKKREGRCPGDYFFFTVYVRHFSGLIEALDSNCSHHSCLEYPRKSSRLRPSRKCDSYCFLYCVQNIFSSGVIEAFDLKQKKAVSERARITSLVGK